MCTQFLLSLWWFCFVIKTFCSENHAELRSESWVHLYFKSTLVCVALNKCAIFVASCTKSFNYVEVPSSWNVITNIIFKTFILMKYILRDKKEYWVCFFTSSLRFIENIKWTWKKVLVSLVGNWRDLLPWRAQTRSVLQETLIYLTISLAPLTTFLLQNFSPSTHNGQYDTPIILFWVYLNFSFISLKFKSLTIHRREARKRLSQLEIPISLNFKKILPNSILGWEILV